MLKAMATINKLPRKPKSTEHKDTDMRLLRKEAYQSSSWRKMRDTYIQAHPLCEDCLAQGKVTAAEDIHHKQSPFKKGEINWSLLLDSNNLKALCKKCHQLEHSKQKGFVAPQQMIAILDELLGETTTKNNEENDDE